MTDPTPLLTGSLSAAAPRAIQLDIQGIVGQRYAVTATTDLVDWVFLETPASAGKNHLQYRAQLVPDMHPDVVAGPHAWWFPERPEAEHGCFESNINALVPLDPLVTPVDLTASVARSYRGAW